MKNVTYSSFEEKCRSCVELVEQRISPHSLNDFLELSFENASLKLTSLPQLFALAAKAPVQLEPLLESPHSGASSVVVEEPPRRRGPLPVDEVERLWFDEENAEESAAPQPTLLLRGVSESLDFFQFADFVSRLAPAPRLRQVRFVIYRGRYSLLLCFWRADAAEKFKGFADRALPRFSQAFGAEARAVYLRNADGGPAPEESAEASVLDALLAPTRASEPPAFRLYSARFVAVVLAGLPAETTTGEVESFLRKYGAPPKAVKLAVVDSRQLGLALFHAVEEAERVCAAVNRAGVLVKCFLHGNSSFAGRTWRNSSLGGGSAAEEAAVAEVRERVLRAREKPVSPKRSREASPAAPASNGHARRERANEHFPHADRAPRYEDWRTGATAPRGGPRRREFNSGEGVRRGGYAHSGFAHRHREYSPSRPNAARAPRTNWEGGAERRRSERELRFSPPRQRGFPAQGFTGEYLQKRSDPPPSRQ